MNDKKAVSGTSKPLNPEIERLLALILQASRNEEARQTDREAVAEVRTRDLRVSALSARIDA